MLKVIGRTHCAAATAEADPWIPLKVSWQVERRGGVLYLLVTGTDGGYVELKVVPESGALYEVVVVDLPPRTSRFLERTPAREVQGAPVLDRELWEWKVTPDYSEPSRCDARVSEKLSYWASDDEFVLWMSDSAPTSFYACGDVLVGVSASGDLVCIVTPNPPVIEPPGYPS